MSKHDVNDIICIQCYRHCRIVELTTGWKKKRSIQIQDYDGTPHRCYEEKSNDQSNHTVR